MKHSIERLRKNHGVSIERVMSTPKLHLKHRVKGERTLMDMIAPQQTKDELGSLVFRYQGSPP